MSMDDLRGLGRRLSGGSYSGGFSLRLLVGIAINLCGAMVLLTGALN